MGRYLNSSTSYVLYKNETMKPYFVDKTKLLSELFPFLEVGNTHICITRPRRFGKTMIANMIASFLGKRKSENGLFESLNISQNKEYIKYKNQYDVIFIDFSKMPRECHSYREYIDRIEENLIRDLKKAYPDIEIYEGDSAADVLETIFEEYDEQRFIFVFDEWDFIFHKDFIKEEDKKQYILFLSNLLKDRPYVIMTYMTGILPIAKYSSGSELNMFWEYNMASETKYSEYFGFIMTAILQSSSVTVSIVLLMASQGLLSLPICFFIILGCNMGSCVSALLASLSGNKGAKRAAMIHFLFNVFGSIIIFTGLSIALEPITNFFLSISGGNLGRSVANAHTTFKIIEVLFMFPCTPLVVALTEKIIPGEDQKVHHNELQYITEISLKSPATMIPQAKNELKRMADMAQENLDRSIKGFLNQSDEYLNKIYHREEDINNVSHAITDYLVKSNQLSLPLADQKILGSMFYVVNDIERIGDHAENFADYTKTELKHNTGLTGDAKEEIKKMYEAVSKLLKLSLESFMAQDGVNTQEDKLAEIAALEASIDKMERRYQKHHIKRLAKGDCEPRAGLLFSDMLSELERIADHSVNIAYSMSDEDEDEMLAAENEALATNN